MNSQKGKEPGRSIFRGEEGKEEVFGIVHKSQMIIIVHK